MKIQKFEQSGFIFDPVRKDQFVDLAQNDFSIEVMS